jgi:hypothetical protein
MLKPGQIAVVGAAETTKIGVVPELSQIGLHADAALNAMADAKLKPTDIDGLACVGPMMPQQVAHYLGITPKWVDGTGVGGCSFMLHVRHAAAAIAAGYCTTVLITHGESGKSRVGATPRPPEPESLAGQFEMPYGPFGPPTLFPIPVLRYMKERGVTDEDLATVAVVQREWAGKNPRAMYRDPDHGRRRAEQPHDRLPHANPGMLPGDGRRRRADPDERRPREGLPAEARLHPRHGRERGKHDGLADGGLHLLPRLPRGGADGDQGGGQSRTADVDHLMIYDAFAHCRSTGWKTSASSAAAKRRPSSARATRARRQAAAQHQRRRPVLHPHRHVRHVRLQESVRQMRGTAPAQVEGAEIGVCHGVGGMFSASGTVVFSNQRP